MKQGHQRRARQCKEAWVKYELDLAEYNRRKSEQEIEERRAANTPYNRIREALEELGATSHPSEQQEQLRELLRTAALKTHDGRTRSRLPARSTSHRKKDQNQRKSAFERLGPSESHTEKVEGTTVKTTESNNQDRSEAKYPFGQLRRTTLTKMTVG